MIVEETSKELKVAHSPAKPIGGIEYRGALGSALELTGVRNPLVPGGRASIPLLVHSKTCSLG